MKNFFTKDNDGELIIEPQVWLLAPFKAIKDKYKDFSLAYVEACIVWFAADYRSDLQDEGTVEERLTSIKKKVYGNRHVKIDKTTIEAVLFYMDERDTPKIKLVRALKESLQKATATINSASMGTMDDIKLLADIVSRLPNLIEGIDKVDSLVKKEASIDKKVVGAGEKGMYEDG
jgi:hypothetical protein